jgi:peroxiredoxin
MLLRVEPVRRELGLSADQTAVVMDTVETAELPLWRLRDLPADERSRAAGPILHSIRTRLGKTLTDRQLDRLDQLVLQAQGIRAVLDPQTANVLKLSSGQRARLRTVLGGSTRNTNAAPAEQGAWAILTAAQRRALASLTGPAFDFSPVPQIACRAPEIEGVTAWINSPALTLARLRGKVVVVHFYAFGCINCIRNLPHYNQWHERFAGRDVVILGIHRPETEAERDVQKVRQKTVEAGIRYPVAVDNESRNWDAWANRVWPSVYLIDKDGCIRYWWYGELNWQGAQGERWMRDRIVELAAAGASSS